MNKENCKINSYFNLNMKKKKRKNVTKIIIYKILNNLLDYKNNLYIIQNYSKIKKLKN